MGRQVARLTALKVGRLKEPGLYPDGGGLYLQITGTGARSWLYRFMLNGRAREMGLGPLSSVGLAEARQAALDARRLRQAGVDPIDARNRQRSDATAAAARAVTFKDTAERFIKAKAPGWRNSKHEAQWCATLERYVYPVFGGASVQAIDTALIMKVLEPIWVQKPETASRVRGRIEAVLDAAKAQGQRQGENPARWRGHLSNLLPIRAKVRRVQHHPALPYGETGSFMAELRQRDGVAAVALEFLILTASRTSETIGATWDEVNLVDAVWTIPADRIKGAKVHRVPLSPGALALLQRMKKHQDASPTGAAHFVFPGDKARKPLSNMAMLALLARMGRGDLTVHGFRSTFRDWAAECTNYPREVAEMALAHVVDDKVEAAYRRGDLFERRRRLMNEWAKFCARATKRSEVVRLVQG
jgi:integrase